MTKLNLKTGNVILTKHDNPVSNLISAFSGYYSHAGIIVQTNDKYIWVLEALGTYRDDLYKNLGFWSRFKFIRNIKKMFGGKVVVSVYDRSFFDKLYDSNRLQVQKYKNLDIDRMRTFVEMMQGREYDYFNVINILLGIVFKKDFVATNESKLFCSELAGLFIENVCNIDVLKTIHKETFEEVTPNDLSICYMKYRDGYSIGIIN
jgi:hypothetical protein